MKSAQKGQALVLVLLSLAVVLTLVLYILSRTVTDIAVSSREEEAVRAFSAAEAGVEKALVAGTIGSIPGAFGDTVFSAETSEFAKNSPDFNYPVNLTSGDSATVWFVSHKDDGGLASVCDATYPCFSGDSMQVCWGKPDMSGDIPAVEVSVFYETNLPRLDGNYSDVKIARAAFDSNAGARANNFSAPDTSDGSCSISGQAYKFGKTINFAGFTPGVNPDGLLFAKARMFYNTDQNHQIGFSVGVAGGTLPSQGLMVNSSGSSGEANRRLEVFQAHPEAPPIFDYVVFSGTGLTK